MNLVRNSMLFVLVVACAPPMDEEAEQQGEKSLQLADAYCHVEVARIRGTDNSHPVAPDADVLVELTEPAEGWDAWIEGVPSVSVHAASGDAVVVRPDQALQPGHEYTLWVKDCSGNVTDHPLPVAQR